MCFKDNKFIIPYIFNDMLDVQGGEGGAPNLDNGDGSKKSNIFWVLRSWHNKKLRSGQKCCKGDINISC